MVNILQPKNVHPSQKFEFPVVVHDSVQSDSLHMQAKKTIETDSKPINCEEITELQVVFSLAYACFLIRTNTRTCSKRKVENRTETTMNWRTSEFLRMI